jgi:hypothetical protein
VGDKVELDLGGRERTPVPRSGMTVGQQVGADTDSSTQATKLRTPCSDERREMEWRGRRSASVTVKSASAEGFRSWCVRIRVPGPVFAQHEYDARTSYEAELQSARTIT